MKKRFSVIVLTFLLVLLPACAQAASAPQVDYVEDDYIQDAPIEDDPVQDAPVEDDPVQDAPVEDDPVQDASVKDDPVQDAPVQDNLVQSGPIQNNSGQNGSVQNDSVQNDYIAAEHTYSNGLPYYIMVNRAQNTVTVYGLDANGYYTVPVKAMICSVGRKGHSTPKGTYTIGGKWKWIHMVDGSYGPYNSQIKGDILFHSVCYSKKDPSTLITEECNGLGERASLGCVRLQTADAKWIYDNCAAGTKITVYDGTSPGPLGKPSRLVDHISPDHPASGWDPTDPRGRNPWHGLFDESASDAGPTESDAEDGNSADAGISGSEPDDESAPNARAAESNAENGNGGDAGISGFDSDIAAPTFSS